MNCLSVSLKQMGELLCSVLKLVDLLHLLRMFFFEAIEDIKDIELIDFPLDFRYILPFNFCG